MKRDVNHEVYTYTITRRWSSLTNNVVRLDSSVGITSNSRCPLSFLIVDAFDARRYRGENFIGDGSSTHGLTL